MHFYQFNIGNYASETSHLDEMEDLAYRRMLDLYFLKEQPLPESLEQIGRLIRMRSHSDCIANVLSEFFTLEDDGYHNHFADESLDKIYSKSAKAKASAEKRWKKKPVKDANASEMDANALPTHSERNPNALPTECEGNATYNILPITQDTEHKELSLSSNDDAVTVLEYLNQVLDTKYKSSTKSHIQNINARLSEGNSVDDLCLVVKAKFEEWNGTHMDKFLRPSTLFQAEKFTGYLRFAKNQPNQIKKRDVNHLPTDWSDDL